MDIKKYTGYFHDGGIIDIFSIDNVNIEIYMESSELLPEWNPDNIPLSVDKTIRGKLHVRGVRNIFISDIPVRNLNKNYDEGEILKFNLYENEIVLHIQWSNFPPKKNTSYFERIRIIAEEIQWENIPNLSDKSKSSYISKNKQL